MKDEAASLIRSQIILKTREILHLIRLNLQLVRLGRALAAFGRLEEAKSALNEAVARCETTLAGFPESEAYCLLAEVARQEGELNTAEELQSVTNVHRGRNAMQHVDGRKAATLFALVLYVVVNQHRIM